MRSLHVVVYGIVTLLLASVPISPASAQTWRNRMKDAVVVVASAEEDIDASDSVVSIPETLTMPADSIADDLQMPGMAPSGSNSILGQPIMPSLYAGGGACGPMGCQPGPRWSIVFDSLMLRPGNSEVTYTVEIDNSDPQLGSPTGPVGTVSPDVTYGFHTGFAYFVDPAVAWGLYYTWYENTASDDINATNGNFLDSQVTYPSLASGGDNSLAASANQYIRFQFLDFEYQRTLCRRVDCDLTLVGGVRLARLDQEFAASQLTGVATGLSNVNTDLQYDGAGLRLGMIGERVNCYNGLMVYGRGFANFLGGRSETQYSHINQFGTSAIAINRDDYRIVSLLEAEVGVGWTSRSRRWRCLLGYQASAWFNTATTGAFIDGVRSRQYDAIGDTLTFDGVIARLEYQR